MPRPALRKRGSHSRSPRRRAGQKSPPPPAVALQQLEQRVGHKAIGERPENSDDSDRLVTRSHSKHRSSSPRREVFSSGAIATGDEPGAYPTRAQRRRHLERDTQQVIKENKERELRRSASASEEAASLRGNSGSIMKDKPQANAGVVVRRSVTKSPQADSTKPQQTPAAELSILGTLKPRKRQASILHIIDNNDSSIITPEDEEQFLPDAVSTPYPSSTKADVSINDSQTPLSSTRKRKRVSEEQAQFNRPLQEPSLQSQTSMRVRDSRPPSGEPSLPTPKKPVPSQAKQPQPSNSKPQDIDDEIMAPPQSSSPAASPEPPAAVAGKKDPGNARFLIPSTQDLQSLMPTKRKDTTRTRSAKNDFEIPEESASDPVDDDSVFVPNKKAKKWQKKDNAAAVKAAHGKTASKAKAKPTGTNNTSTTPATPHPSTIRTPLPLSRSVNAENRRLRTPAQTATTGKTTTTTKGKSQSLNSKLNSALSSAKKNKSLTESKPTPTKNFTKPSQPGGASHSPTRSTRATRSTRRTTTADDKENRTPSAALCPGLTSPTTADDDMDLFADDQIHPTIELDHHTTTPRPKPTRKTDTNNRVGKSMTTSPTMPRSTSRYGSARKRNTGRQTSASAVAAAATSWANQWAGIDEYSLDFEEVSGSLDSDSPMAR